jgi:hypothetical protein
MLMKKFFKLLLIPALVSSCVLCITAETAKAQPANDLCADAIGPLAVPSTTAGTTVGATIDGIAPFCVTAVTSPGVWYTVMGTGNTMTVSTCDDASYDSKISVYCADCASLICVNGNDDAVGCAGFTSKLDFCSIAGAEYRVLVHGFGGATGTFNLTIADDGNPCAGAVGCPVPAPPPMAPTMTEWGMITLILLLIGTVLRKMKTLLTNRTKN